MTARIYQPSKTALQSGVGKTKTWILEFVPDAPRGIDPLMGYTTSADTQQQVRLKFETREAAIAYAEENGIAYTLFEPTKRRPIPKSYSDNFKFGRIGSWTH